MSQQQLAKIEKPKILGIDKGIALPLLELFVATGLALISYVTITNDNDAVLAAAFIGAVGALHALHRVISTHETTGQIEDLSTEFDRFRGVISADVYALREVVRAGLESIDSRVSRSEISTLYAQIDDEFEKDRDQIIETTRKKLKDLYNNKESSPYKKGEYYTWISRNMRKLEGGDRVLAISCMKDSEWDDSNEERTFFELNCKKAQEGVQIQRIFVMPSETYDKARQQDRPQDSNAINARVVIDAHSDEGVNNLIGYFVDEEKAKRSDSELVESIKDGFLMFHFVNRNEKVVMLDDFDEHGNARGRVSKRSDTIADLVRAFDNLKNFGSSTRIS
jgi:hypothetical protein